MISLMLIGSMGLLSACTKTNATDDGLVKKSCQFASTYQIVEKLSLQDQTGATSYVLANEFQSEPVLLHLESEFYEYLEVGKTYTISFEGSVSVPDISDSKIPIDYVLNRMNVNKIVEVDTAGLENPQTPLACR